MGSRMVLTPGFTGDPKSHCQATGGAQDELSKKFTRSGAGPSTGEALKSAEVRFGYKQGVSFTGIVTSIDETGIGIVAFNPVPFCTGAVVVTVVTTTVAAVFGTVVGTVVGAELGTVTGICTFIGLCRVSTLLPPAFTEVSVII